MPLPSHSSGLILAGAGLLTTASGMTRMTGIGRTTGLVAAVVRWVVGRVAGFFLVAGADSVDVDSSVVSVSTSVEDETQPAPATAQMKPTQTVRQNRIGE